MRIGQPTNRGLLDARYLQLTGGTLTGLTVNSATITLSQDTNFVLSGGVNGVSFNTDTLSIDATNGRVGIGTTGPGQKLHVVGTDENVVLVENTSSASALNWSGYYMKNDLGKLGLFIFSNSNNTFVPSIYGTSRLTFEANGAGGMQFLQSNATAANNIIKFSRHPANSDQLQISMLIDGSGNVGIGTTAPTNLLSLGGNSARIFWMERHTTADTAGNTLTITAGGATAAATNKAGGDLILTPGLSTGTGESGVQIKGVPAGSTGTVDGTQTTAIQVLGNKIGFYAATPVVKQTGCAVPTDLTTAIAAITALRTALNNLGLTTVV